MSQKMIAIAGAKGGVGRSTIATNMAWQLAKSGFKTILMDANFGLGNDDLMLGLCPDMSVKDVLERDKTLEEVAIKLHSNLTLIPSSSGDFETANANPLAVEGIFYDLEHAFIGAPFLVVDTEADISERTRHLLHCADHVVITLTPDSTALANSYATLKMITSRKPPKPNYQISILVNQTHSEIDGQEAFDQISRLSQKYLGQSLEFLGAIPFDEKVTLAAQRHLPFVEAYPRAKASKALFKIIQQLQVLKKNAPYASNSILNDYLKPLLTGQLSSLGVTRV